MKQMHSQIEVRKRKKEMESKRKTKGNEKLLIYSSDHPIKSYFDR